ncbi:MAG: PopZ family protein [Aestuariivirga sp.]
MDDILASIRNAINEDIETKHPRGAMPSDLPGAMREIRARLGEDVTARPARDTAVADWRSRSQSLSREPVRETPRAVVEERAPPQRHSPGFAGILGGEARTYKPIAAEYVPLRGTYADEPAPEPPRPAYEDQRYREPSHYASAAYLPLPGYDPRDPGLMSNEAGSATASAFQHLAETILARATGDRGIEDMTRELLRSMLKQWLDDNLPALAERLVREEIERVARRGR